jgi:hypothetical protein
MVARKAAASGAPAAQPKAEDDSCVIREQSPRPAPKTTQVRRNVEQHIAAVGDVGEVAANMVAAAVMTIAAVTITRRPCPPRRPRWSRPRGASTRSSSVTAIAATWATLTTLPAVLPKLGSAATKPKKGGGVA